MLQNGQIYFKKSCGVTARFLKYVWPFYNIMHERVKRNPEICPEKVISGVEAWSKMVKRGRGLKYFHSSKRVFPREGYEDAIFLGNVYSAMNSYVILLLM